MRIRILSHTFATWLLALSMLVGTLPAVALAQVAPAPLTIPNVTLSPGGFLWAIVRQPDGGTVFSGYFTSVNGMPRGHIARLLPNGALDPDWNPSANALVKTLAVDSSGAVYAGGGFDVIGGRGRSMVGKLAGSGSGAADPNWNADVRSTAGGGVEALALDNAGALYVGGGFTSVGGLSRFSIAKVSASGTGAVDANWNPSPSWTIHTLAVDGAGSVYVGGEFTQIGGQMRGYIAKLSGSGTGAADANWNPAANGRVSTLLLDGSGAVYVGGLFNSIGGQTRSHIAKLAAGGTGAADASWNPSADAEVLALAVDGASVYAGGSFVNIGGQPRNHLARLPAAGSGAADAVWNPSPDGDVHGLTMGENGSVHVAGMFYTIGGEPRNAPLAVLPATVIWRTVTYAASANGTISGTSAQTVPDGGRGTEVTAVPDSGYYFAQWNDGSHANPRIDINVTANLSVSASFALNTYTVSATAGVNGIITPLSQTVDHGATTTFTLTPAAGYHASVTGCDGSLNGLTYTTGPITANCAVSATFALNTYTATATAGANGAITPASQSVNHGTTTTFTVTPDANYHVSVSGCGGSLSGTTYTTGAITADCAVSASFTNDPVELTLAIDASRDYVRYGQVLTYAVNLSNTGTGAANAASIAMVLPPQLDAGNTAWICTNGGAGAQCTASGSGALQDTGVVLPAGRSLTWLVTAPVRLNAPGADIETTVSASAGAIDANADNRITLVTMRDGFELNGDGVGGDLVSCPSEPAAIDEAWAHRFTLPSALSGLIDTVFAARDPNAGFRIERANLGDTTQVQVIAIAADGRETASAWAAVQNGATLTLATMLAANGQRTLILDGAATLLSTPLSLDVSDALRIKTSATPDAGCN